MNSTASVRAECLLTRRGVFNPGRPLGREAGYKGLSLILIGGGGEGYLASNFI
jgi:hypothetical protein